MSTTAKMRLRWLLLSFWSAGVNQLGLVEFPTAELPSVYTAMSQSQDVCNKSQLSLLHHVFRYTAMVLMRAMLVVFLVAKIWGRKYTYKYTYIKIYGCNVKAFSSDNS